jgi:hypothetical protein
MWLFFGLPLFTIFTMLLIHAKYSIDKVKQHWEEYRCHPAYIPFAGMIQSNVSVTDNFTHCMNILGTDVFKLILDPLNALFGEISSTLGEFISPLKLFRQLFSRIRKFMLSFASSTFSKITSSTSVFVHYLIKIRDVLKRFIGEGYIAAFLVNAIADFVMAFVYLCISVIKTFVYALLVISFILAIFQPEMLVVAITLASMIAASGF